MTDTQHPLDEPSQVDAIAEAFSEAIRRGESPSIDAEVARHGDPTGQLRSLLESIAMIESLKSSSPSAGPDGYDAASNLHQLDDYRIVREIGRGGMGVVFEAIHQPLSRRVAVKVLARQSLEQQQGIERFRREAQAAARLRHPNIVPVFGVGYAAEHHYYVMDLIDGISLRQWLQSFATDPAREPITVDEHRAKTELELDLDDEKTSDQMSSGGAASMKIRSPEYCRWAASIGETICDALQYAHHQGVLHRDIKPANLLIDAKNHIWVADFGLAKLVEQQNVTRTGDVVGTPQYMPPESFEGTYDIRSEVYGVGLTLYELLTGCPAVTGGHPAEIIRNATSGVQTSPRKLNPAIPRDLETILLKSLAHAPGNRYATAGELRDDLQRFLESRPILARPTGPIGRLLRWSRREPAIASMTFATFLLLIALATVSAIGYWKTSHSLTVASAAESAARRSLQKRTEALNQAESQRLRAEANLQVALTAFDRVMQNITDRGIHADADFLGEATDRITPNVTPDDARMLQSLLGFFDELATNNSEDLLNESALAARRAGDIYASLGQLQQADRAYTDALARYRQISRQQPDDLASIVTQAEIMNELAAILSLRGQLGRAMQFFGDTIALLEQSDAILRSPSGSFQYARAHRLYASLSSRAGLDASTIEPHLRSIRFKRSPIGKMLRLRAEDELVAAKEAIETLEHLLSTSPEDSKLLAELARAFRTQAQVSARVNQRVESEWSIRRSIELFEQLLQKNQESESIRYELAMTLSSSEAFGWNQMRRARQAIDLSATLRAQHPDQQRYQALQARSLESMSRHQQRLGAIREAQVSIEQAVKLYQQLVANTPELGVYATYLATALESLADLHQRQGSKDEAKASLQQAIDVLQQAFGASNASPLARIQLQRLRQKLERTSATR